MSVLPAVFLKGTVLSAGAAVLVGIFGYLTRRLLVNNMPENDYAFFYSVFAIMNLLIIFLQSGTSDILLFEVPRLLESEKKRCAGASYAFIRKFQSVNALIGTVIMILCFPLFKKYYFSYPVSWWNFAIFAMLIWGHTLENTALFALNTLKRFGTVAVLRIIKSFLFFTGACIALVDSNLAAIILVCVLATNLCTFSGDFIVRRSGMLSSGQKSSVKLQKMILRMFPEYMGLDTTVSG